MNDPEIIEAEFPEENQTKIVPVTYDPNALIPDLPGLPGGMSFREFVSDAFRKSRKVKVSRDLVYRVGRWTNVLFNDAIKDGFIHKETIDEGVEINRAWEQYEKEVFTRMYSYYPEMVPEEERKCEAEWAVACHQEAEKIAEWQQLEGMCSGNAQLSSIAAQTICEEVLKVLQENQKKNPPDPQPMDDAAEQLQQAMTGDPATDGPMKGAVKKLQAAAARARQEWKSQAPKPEDVRIAQRAAVKQAIKDVQDMKDAMSALGWGDEIGQAQNVGGAKEKSELARRLVRDKKLMQVALMAGRMVSIALKKQATKTRYARTEIYGVEVGDDLSRVLPSEMALLSDPDLEDLFYSKYAEKKLEQYEISGKEKEAKGPIFMWIDSSGSMHGQPEMWSKAVALALAAVARKQKRPMGVGMFTTQVHKPKWFWPDRINPVELSQMIDTFHNGGTAFEPPLQDTFDVIEKKDFKKADIVFVTDGECDISPQFEKKFNEMRKQRGVSVYGVLIGTWGNGEILKKFSDEVVVLRNLEEEEAAFEIFGKV